MSPTRLLPLLLMLLVAARAGAADTTPPAAVTLSGVAGIQSATLSWTAPGDDGTTGTADHYDLRVSSSAITAANFSSAVPVAGVSAPQQAGAAESFLASSLLANVTYHFALVTYDAANNASPVSNDVAVTALPPPPVISNPPDASGYLDASFSYDIIAVGSVDSYSATGLPPGLVLDSSSGTISGTPTSEGTYPVTLGATNVSGTGTASITITITPAPPAPVGGGDTSSKKCGLGSGLGLLALSLWAATFRRAQRSRSSR